MKLTALRAGCLPVIVGCAALVPDAAAACTASAEDLRFDAMNCLEIRAHPPGNVLLNHCNEPIAMLVVVCDLAEQPECKVDPVASKGWSAYRGVEYVAPASKRVGALDTLRKAGSARLGELAPFAPGLQKGRRAQIAACKLDLRSSLANDPCAQRLAKLKRSIDASHGKSLRATLADKCGDTLPWE